MELWEALPGFAVCFVAAVPKRGLRHSFTSLCPFASAAADRSLYVANPQTNEKQLVKDVQP